MAQRLQLAMSQQLKLTHQLQQAIHMLQLSSQELAQQVDRILESNVILEYEEEQIPTQMTPPREKLEIENSKETTSEEPLLKEASVSKMTLNTPEDDTPWEDKLLQKETLTDYLLWQLRLLGLSETEFWIGEILVRSIGEDGFLNTTLEEIHSFLSQEKLGLSIDMVESVLEKIQRFDPTGVGARNLQESLLLQLAALPQTSNIVTLATQLISEYLEQVIRHEYLALCRLCQVERSTLDQALTLIQSLKPRPGKSFQIGLEPPQHVAPDVFVIKKQDSWHVSLNPDLLPRIRFNQQYLSMSRERSESTYFIQQHLQEARWLMKCLQTRNETLMRVSGCIVEQQKMFMEYGRGALKPLILQEVADALDLHPSTISRITTQKYIQTPQGTFELKFFFSSGLKTSYGESCSSSATQAYIQDMIRNENACKPLSDESIAKLLGEQGIQIARRTVAKYRDILAIPSAFERKQMSGLYKPSASE